MSESDDDSSRIIERQENLPLPRAVFLAFLLSWVLPMIAIPLWVFAPASVAALSKALHVLGETPPLLWWTLWSSVGAALLFAYCKRSLGAAWWLLVLWLGVLELKYLLRLFAEAF